MDTFSDLIRAYTQVSTNHSASVIAYSWYAPACLVITEGLDLHHWMISAETQ